MWISFIQIRLVVIFFISESHDNISTILEISKICYQGFRNSRSEKTFNFVLTNHDSKFTYCFCIYNSNQCVLKCFLSALPWFEGFQVLLLCMSVFRFSEHSYLLAFLGNVYHKALPLPGEILRLNNSISFEVPDPSVFPVANYRLTFEGLKELKPFNIITIFMALLFERRVLIISDDISKASSCCFAFSSLLYPMTWEHTFIPILSENMLPILQSPPPFLVGLHRSLLPKLDINLDDEEIVIFDIESECIKYPKSEHKKDLISFGTHNEQKLVAEMKKNNKQGLSIAIVFLKFMVNLLSHILISVVNYNKKFSFNHQDFVDFLYLINSRPLLKRISETQIFEIFANDKMNEINLKTLNKRAEFESKAFEYLNYLSKINSGIREKLSLLENFQGETYLIDTPMINEALNSDATVEEPSITRNFYKSINELFNKDQNVISINRESVYDNYKQLPKPVRPVRKPIQVKQMVEEEDSYVSSIKLKFEKLNDNIISMSTVLNSNVPRPPPRPLPTYKKYLENQNPYLIPTSAEDLFMKLELKTIAEKNNKQFKNSNDIVKSAQSNRKPEISKSLDKLEQKPIIKRYSFKPNSQENNFVFSQKHTSTIMPVSPSSEHKNKTLNSLRRFRNSIRDYSKRTKSVINIDELVKNDKIEEIKFERKNSLKLESNKVNNEDMNINNNKPVIKSEPSNKLKLYTDFFEQLDKKNQGKKNLM